ncbi:MAG: exodeoxyribonuclease V subunit alpha [Idiomarina sp.]|nr:exodeoxyribonuclease V subunit alpha [Idiomarina sp.]
MNNSLATVQSWLNEKVVARELRPIDVELPAVLQKLSPEQSEHAPLLALLCALVSHQYGRGHSCLRLNEVCAEPTNQLGIDIESARAIRDLLNIENVHSALAVSDWVERREAGELSVQKPLVWCANRLYLARLWKAEQQVAQAIAKRITKQVPSAQLGELLQRVFAAELEENQHDIHWQSLACAMAVQRQFTIITGGPGTGKTTTVVRLLAILLQSGGSDLRIRLAAPTGKAAARLTESIAGAINRLPEAMQPGIPTEVVTLHKLLGAKPFRRSFKHNSHRPLAADVVVVDEASMVDVEMMASLMAALPANAKLILLGDKDQLASVEAGSVLGDLCRNAELGNYLPETLAMLAPYAPAQLQDYGASNNNVALSPSIYNQATVMLRKSHRFGERSGIGSLARAVNAGASETLALFERFADIDLLITANNNSSELKQLIVEGYRAYLQLAKQSDAVIVEESALSARDQWAKQVLQVHRSFQLLVALRKGNWGVAGLNQHIAEWLQRAGLIERSKGWYVGRPVLVQRNNYTLNLMNGDIGITLLDPHTGKLRVVFEQADGGVRWVLPSRLSDVETVFALTVHKSQGSEFKHTVMALPDEFNPLLTRELVYTGITRASEHFTLVTPKQAIFEAAVQQRVVRSSGL